MSDKFPNLSILHRRLGHSIIQWGHYPAIPSLTTLRRRAQQGEMVYQGGIFLLFHRHQRAFRLGTVQLPAGVVAIESLIQLPPLGSVGGDYVAQTRESVLQSFLADTVGNTLPCQAIVSVSDSGPCVEQSFYEQAGMTPMGNYIRGGCGRAFAVLGIGFHRRPSP